VIQIKESIRIVNISIIHTVVTPDLQHEGLLLHANSRNKMAEWCIEV